MLGQDTVPDSLAPGTFRRAFRNPGSPISPVSRTRACHLRSARSIRQAGACSAATGPHPPWTLRCSSPPTAQEGFLRRQSRRKQSHVRRRPVRPIFDHHRSRKTDTMPDRPTAAPRAPFCRSPHSRSPSRFASQEAKRCLLLALSFCLPWRPLSWPSHSGQVRLRRRKLSSPPLEIHPA